MLTRPVPAHVLHTVRSTLEGADVSQPGAVVLLRNVAAVLANVATRVAHEDEWMAAETDAITARLDALAVVDDAVDTAADAASKTVAERYLAASARLCTVIDVLDRTDREQLEAVVLPLLRERVEHERAIMGNPF